MKSSILRLSKACMIALPMSIIAACTPKTETTTTATPPAEKQTAPNETASSPIDFEKATGTYSMKRTDDGGELLSELKFKYIPFEKSLYSITFSRGNDERTVNGSLFLADDEVFVSDDSEGRDCKLSMEFKNDQFEVHHSDQVISCGGTKEDLAGIYVRTSSSVPTF